MKFNSPLLSAKLIQRYKRFFCDAELTHERDVITAHVPNTGTMKTCGDAGAKIWLSKSDNPTRKLQFTWELTEISKKQFIGVNTSRPNFIVEEAIAEKKIVELKDYHLVKREIKINAHTRFDLLLENKQKEKCYIEIKNTTLLHDGCIKFPDAVTERGKKHLEELIKIKQEGHRAIIFFLVNRTDAISCSIADHIDSAYAATFKKAMEEGVEVFSYKTSINLKEQKIDLAIPFLF